MQQPLFTQEALIQAIYGVIMLEILIILVVGSLLLWAKSKKGTAWIVKHLA